MPLAYTNWQQVILRYYLYYNSWYKTNVRLVHCASLHCGKCTGWRYLHPQMSYTMSCQVVHDIFGCTYIYSCRMYWSYICILYHCMMLFRIGFASKSREWRNLVSRNNCYNWMTSWGHWVQSDCDVITDDVFLIFN